MEGRGNLLVLCVDRDNDVGRSLKVRTPIIGESDVLRAAVEYAMLNPEDSDANAMFAALQTYRELREVRGDRVEIAVAAGLPEEGIKADMKLLQEMDEILSKIDVEGVVLVSDGPTDEQVIPLIQSRAPLVSVRRVIVQQSRGVEESFVIIVRYMRRLIEDERYRRYTLGIPGSFIMLYVVLAGIVPNYAWPLLVFLGGLVLFFKGFSIDAYLRGLYSTSPTMFVSVIVSAILILLATIGGVSSVMRLPAAKPQEVMGYFLLAFIGEQVFVLDLIVIAVVLPLAGKIVDSVLQSREVRVSDYGFLALAILSRQILMETGRIMVGSGNLMDLLFWILGMFLVAMFQVGISSMLRRKGVK